LLHLFFSGLHQQRSQPAAPLSRVHIEGYDVPCGAPMNADALDNDKAGQLALGLLGDPAGQLGWVRK